MKNTFRLKRALFAGLMITFLSPADAFSDDTFDKLCVFGDSLSDTGNVFKVTHDVSTRPYSMIPSGPYPIGGLTFSNGKTWIQRYAKSIGRSRDAKPALRSKRFCNYAFGSARARQRSGDPFDLPDQVDAYLQKHTVADPNTLYVVFVGGNDVRDALVAWNPSDTAVSLNILSDAVDSIVASITQLTDAGAKYFLVMNAPNVSLVPAVRMQGLPAQALALFLSSTFNFDLASELGTPPSGTDLIAFDLFAFTSGIPTSGLGDTENSCITPDVRKDAICAHPSQYAFWDGIHPTKVIHANLAKAVAQQLASR